MRVLHLPVNTSSQVNILVRALRDIGVEARGLVLDYTSIQDHSDVDIYRVLSKRSNIIYRSLNSYTWWKDVLSAIHWADVIHWHCEKQVLPKNLDLKYIAFLKKSRIVSFWGSEIRIPSVAIVDNPYLEKILGNGKNEYKISFSRSRRTQEKFSRYGFECTIPGPELIDYIQSDLFKNPFRIEASLNLSCFSPQYPDPHNDKPLIIHTPSNELIKGTQFVIRAIDRLKSRYSFTFKELNNVDRKEVLSIMSRADIVLDQFVIGSFGTVSLEAMALGKPTVCYLKPSIFSRITGKCPIVNATQDNLELVLEELLLDGRKRHEIGKKGRKYIEDHHDSHKWAEKLKEKYETMMRKST